MMDIHLFSSKPIYSNWIEKIIIENCLLVMDSARIHTFYNSEVFLNTNKIKTLTIWPYFLSQVCDSNFTIVIKILN